MEHLNVHWFLKNFGSFIKRSILLLSLFIAAIASCESDCGHDASSKHFTSRTKVLFDKTPEAGDLDIEIINAIPKVEVPEPHLPTVTHLNAEICSWSTKDAAYTTDEDGKTVQEPRDGSSRCMPLTPSIYTFTVVRFAVPSKDLHNLINGEYDTLTVKFASSTQTTSSYYLCIPGRPVVEHAADKIKKLKITGDGQHSLSFNCHP